MIRRVAVFLALAVVAAGCAGLALARIDEHGSAGGSPAAPKSKPSPEPASTLVTLTIVDGDTLRRVGGARVTIGPRSALTDRLGQAKLRIRRRAALPVSIRAREYTAKTIRVSFQRRRKFTLRIYRPALQWPMYGGGYARTQAHEDISLRPPFRVVWSRGVGSLVEFPAVVSDGVGYVGNQRGTIYAIELRRGRIVWKYDPPGGKMASSPAIVGRTLVVHGMDGIVRVLDRRNGDVLWHTAVGSPIESSPIVRDGVDYFGAWNGTVYALDLRSRRIRWTYRAGYKITSSAALAGGTLFIGDYGGRLLALSAANGRLRWARSVNGRIYGTPAVASGRVFVPSSTGGSLTAFSTSGRYLWRVGTGGYVYSSPAVWGGRVYFGSYNGRLYAVAAASGRVLWTVGAGGPVSGAAVVVAGVAYAGSTWGSIVGANARSGRVLMRFPHGEYVPVSGNGRVLLLHGYSRIYAVEPVRR